MLECCPLSYNGRKEWTLDSADFSRPWPFFLTFFDEAEDLWMPLLSCCHFYFSLSHLGYPSYPWKQALKSLNRQCLRLSICDQQFVSWWLSVVLNDETQGHVCPFQSSIPAGTQRFLAASGFIKDTDLGSSSSEGCFMNRNICVLFIEMVDQHGKSGLFPAPGSEWTWDSRLGDITSCQLPGTSWINTQGPVNTHLWANVSLSFPRASIKCSLHSPWGTW